MKVRVTISGLTPLLMNRFTEEAEINVTSGTRPVMAGKDGTPREQATPKAYRHSDGTLYVPGTNIFRSLIDAGRFHKAGRRQLTTTKESLIPAGCLVLDLACSLGTKDFEVDSRSIVNPATGGRRMCHRPRIDEWTLSFTLDIDTTVFNPALIRLVLDDAGKKIGLGDYRPQRKGPFGRFVVSGWTVIDETAEAA